MIYIGLNLILMGYFKKVAIADTLAPIVDNIFADPKGLSSGALLTGAYGFAIQVYGDFSGYTDIARGVARLLGFELMENFSAPYLSRTVTEFWRRWHISLSSWLRDYLYISMGGNRKGIFRTYVNLFITMLLAGLWHGAAWTFVAFGGIHGIYLIAERLKPGGRRFDMPWPTKALGWLKQVGMILLTFHLWCVSMVLFRSQSLALAWEYFKGIARFENPWAIGTPVLLAMGTMAVWDIMQTKTKNHAWLLTMPRPVRFAVVQMLIVCILAAAVYHVNTVIPFIYFQF
jgi:D-alanyl-lipoteichoic acid acyltransferase DltB (MBOAT superfamily)